MKKYLIKLAKEFIQESKIINEDNSILLIKKGFNKDQKYTLKIYFESNPLVLRKVDLKFDDILLTLSFFNHNYNFKSI